MTTLARPLALPRRQPVDGAWNDIGDGHATVVLDKYHGTELATLPHATAQQMDEAIAAAVRQPARARAR